MNAKLVTRGLQVEDSNPLPVTLTVPPAGVTMTEASFVRGAKIPAATDTPEALAAAGTLVQSVAIYGQRGARTGNTSSVWIDSVPADGSQQIEIPPGAALTLVAPPGKLIDLSGLYVDSETSGDGVFYFGLR
jgi:hypothetical protein